MDPAPGAYHSLTTGPLLDLYSCDIATILRASLAAENQALAHWPLFRDLLNLVKEFSCAGRMCQENDQHSGSAPQRRNEMLRHLGVIKALARRVARLRRYRMPVEQMLRPSSDKLDH